MTEGTLDRRTLLRRVAIAGGALLWTTPVVQVVGPSALGATGSPVPEEPEYPGQGLSYVAIVYVCGTTTFRAKYELDTGWDPEPKTLPSCSDPGQIGSSDTWTTATPVDGGAEGLLFDVAARNAKGEPTQVTVTVPEGCIPVTGVAMSADQCGPATADTSGPRTLLFVTPAPAAAEEPTEEATEEAIEEPTEEPATEVEPTETPEVTETDATETPEVTQPSLAESMESELQSPAPGETTSSETVVSEPTTTPTATP